MNKRANCSTINQDMEFYELESMAFKLTPFVCELDGSPRLVVKDEGGGKVRTVCVGCGADNFEDVPSGFDPSLIRTGLQLLTLAGIDVNVMLEAVS